MTQLARGSAVIRRDRIDLLGTTAIHMLVDAKLRSQSFDTVIERGLRWNRVTNAAAHDAQALTHFNADICI